MGYKYKVGDHVKVVGNECGHFFLIGQVVKVIALDEKGRIDECVSLDGKLAWCMIDDEVVPV